MTHHRSVAITTYYYKSYQGMTHTRADNYHNMYLPKDEPDEAIDCAICFHLSKYMDTETTIGMMVIPRPSPACVEYKISLSCNV